MRGKTFTCWDFVYLCGKEIRSNPVSYKILNRHGDVKRSVHETHPNEIKNIKTGEITWCSDDFIDYAVKKDDSISKKIDESITFEELYSLLSEKIQNV